MVNPEEVEAIIPITTRIETVPMTQKLEDLRDLVFGYDIPSPTCPEYVEHHTQIQAILTQIDKILDEELNM